MAHFWRGVAGKISTGMAHLWAGDRIASSHGVLPGREQCRILLTRLGCVCNSPFSDARRQVVATPFVQLFISCERSAILTSLARCARCFASLGLAACPALRRSAVASVDAGVGVARFFALTAPVRPRWGPLSQTKFASTATFGESRRL